MSASSNASAATSSSLEIKAITHTPSYFPKTNYADDLRYFSSTYAAAQARFRTAVTKAKGTLFEVQLGPLGPDSKPIPFGEPLATDIAWFGAEKPEKIMWISCGMHGPGMYKGAAAQLKFLDYMPKIPDNMAIVMIFALNPSACYWNRLVNEDGVDPRCSFPSPESKTSEIYTDYEHILNPDSAPFETFSDLSWLRLTPGILWEGSEKMEEEIAKGQYNYKQGIFYGGGREPRTITSVLKWIEPRIKNVSAIVAIDEHTGIGPYGDSTILTPAQKGSYAHQTLEELFKGHILTRQEHYACRGGMLEALASKVNEKAKKILLTHHLGTRNRLTSLLSSLDQLKVIREENRHHHWGNMLDKRDEYMNHWTKQNLMATFNPADPDWRRSGVANSHHVFVELWNKLIAMPTEQGT